VDGFEYENQDYFANDINTYQIQHAILPRGFGVNPLVVPNLVLSLRLLLIFHGRSAAVAESRLLRPVNK
jgi:hypothetical protein